jgi:hypothetical protein
MTIQINKKTFQTPDNWNDCTLEQLLACYQIIMSDTTDIFDLDEVIPLKRIQLIQYLLGINQRFLNHWEKDCIKNYGEENGELIFQAELKELTEKTTIFAFETDTKTGECQLRFSLTKNPFPFFKFPRKKAKKNRPDAKLYGPADGLDNLSFYELCTTFTIFEYYLEHRNEAIIDELIATLYRPRKANTLENRQKDYEGDIRLPLLRHETTVKKRIPLVRNFHPLSKAVILFWFASCRQHIINSYPNIFTQEKNVLKKAGNDYGYGALLINLAGGLVHLDTVAARNHKDAFTYLSYLEDQRKLQALRQEK